MSESKESKSGAETKFGSGLDTVKAKLSGKLSGAGIAEGNPSGDLIRRLYPFMQSRASFGLEEYIERHADRFDPDEEENKLEYTTLFQKFEKLMESFLAEFIREEGIDETEFNRQLKDVSASPSGRNDVMVKMIVAQTDYEYFVSLMKDKAREQQLAAKSAAGAASEGKA